jgi:hypothetical protein
MKAIYDSCMAAEISIPEEVEKFFNWERPDPAGVIINLDESHVEKSTDDAREFLTVKLNTLNPNITAIRFCNSCIRFCNSW